MHSLALYLGAGPEMGDQEHFGGIGVVGLNHRYGTQLLGTGSYHISCALPHALCSQTHVSSTSS